jgi:GntR family transcriptional regulator
VIKYQSIRDEVRDLVAGLDVGDALPAERGLAVELGVSRMTLRRAIDELVREGLIVRRHGAGTFVAEPKIAQTLAVTSFSQDMRQRGFEPSSRTLSLEEAHAGPQLGRRLSISPSDRILRIARLRLADEAPMAIETLHVPLALLGQVAADDLENASFYELLATKGVHIDRGVQTIEPTVTDERESELLGVPLHSPAFLFERSTWDVQGRAVEFVRSVYRGDRYKLTAELHPTRAGQTPVGEPV